MSIKSGCGNPECSASTGYFSEYEGWPLSGLTFGSGRVDQYGYFEFPCSTCAQAFEKLHPEATPCWPNDDFNFATYKYDDTLDKL